MPDSGFTTKVITIVWEFDHASFCYCPPQGPLDGVATTFWVVRYGAIACPWGIGMRSVCYAIGFMHEFFGLLVSIFGANTRTTVVDSRFDLGALQRVHANCDFAVSFVT